MAGDGEVRGIVDLSDGASVRWVGPEQLWVVERDAFEVQWLVGYRLR